MANRWQSATSVWLEDTDTGQFELVASHGLGERSWRAGAAQQLDTAKWLGAALPLTCSCSAVFPPDFAFCPQCGAALQQPAGWLAGSLSAANAASASGPASAVVDGGAPWLGPYADQDLPEHVPKGLALSAFSLAARLPLPALPSANPGIARPDTSLPAPPAAPCVFFSGRFGFAEPRLLALAYRQNVLQYWNPHAKDWQLLAAAGVAAAGSAPDPQTGFADPAFTNADYYCLAPMSDEPGAVAIVPTHHGLMQLKINPLLGSYELQPVLAANLLSAPGRVFQHLACLYWQQDQIMLWTRATEGASVLASSHDQHWPTGIPAQCAAGWSRPVAYQGKLIWLHAQGHLLWQPGSAPKWLPWPQGWQPRHAYAAPMQSRDGRLWLLGQQQQAYGFLELGSTQPQQEAADGARLGFAQCVFRLGHPLHGEPWGSFTLENENDHNALVWPLLGCYDSDKRQQGALVVRMPGYVGTAEQLFISRASIDSKLEWVGETHLELERLQLARPWELSCFVHDGCLWMAHPDWTQMRGWRLRGGA